MAITDKQIADAAKDYYREKTDGNHYQAHYCKVKLLEMVSQVPGIQHWPHKRKRGRPKKASLKISGESTILKGEKA